MLPIIRLLVIIAVLAALVFGSMIALTTLVEPEQREYSSNVPPSAFNK